MNLLFIFTGGTIGCTISNNTITVENQSPYILIEKYKSIYGIDFSFDVYEPYKALSENNTGETLKALIEAVDSHINKGFDGIIVTHGTDTLQYSAAALAYTLGNCSTPVCIVSANYVLDDKRSNGIQNLHGAISFIKQEKSSGVWVVYKNTLDATKIHRASRLLSSRDFSDDVFSAGNSFYGHFDENNIFIKNSDYHEFSDEIHPLDYHNLTSRCKSVLRIEPYVGMTYHAINPETKYVLLNSFHSGTVNTQAELDVDFYHEAYRKGIKIFVTGVYASLTYESATLFEKLHLIPLKNIAPIAAYIKLWLSENEPNAQEIMTKSLGSDKW